MRADVDLCSRGAFFTRHWLCDDPVKAVLKCGAAEIDEESDRELHQPEVGQQLFAVDGRKCFNGLQFDDDPFIYQ